VRTRKRHLSVRNYCQDEIIGSMVLAEGYLKVEGQMSIAPICPIPPLPGIGQDTFFGGYNQGFIDGMAEAGVKLKDEEGEDVDPQ
jgi:hypothetical protein